MFVVGLTGGLATGKSTVLQIFKEHGIPVIDADQIAREIIEPGQPAWELIKKEFGPEILNEDGCVNRIRLGAIVFEDENKRQRLNQITHPRIQRILAKKAILNFLNGHAFIVMELPLLFETGRMMGFMHKIITVMCEDDQQLERLCNRNDFSPEIAKKRIETQMPLDQKAANSQFIIDNTGTFQETRKQTESIIKLLQSLKFHWYMRGGIAALIIGVPCLIIYLYLTFFR